MRRLPALIALCLAAWLTPPAARADIPGNKVRVGVLTDMGGPFADQVGPGSVAAARLAAEDFAAESRGLQVEILSADHQNKPDVGSAIARRWFDTESVDAIVDLPNSGVALSVITVAQERHKTALASSSMSSDITGKACQPTTVQWISDTWAQGRSTVLGLKSQGLDKWYFLTVNYALGLSLEADATTALKSVGGSVKGSSRIPLGTTDFGAPLLQAQSSGANVLAIATTGSDMVNAVKQAREFGLSDMLTPAALFIQLSDVEAIGLPVAQGLQFTSAFYWDLNEGTRAFGRRFGAAMAGRMPTEDHAGVYSATLAYLRAVRDARTTVGEEVVAEMRKAPIADPLFGAVTIRADGRVLHNMYRFRVKAPAQSKSRWDLYERLATIPAAEAFRPLEEGGCKLIPGK